ncbi:MAG: hypothetical protein HY514_03080 [Candidatus Aenigmarchaeota archaeon]|nr:hypothetical protein [Candidatus Aenigmarchaeota archaeon]
MQIIKQKQMAVLMIGLVMLASISAVHAQSFAVTKTKILNGIDKVIAKLNDLEAKIQSISGLSQETKDLTISNLEDLEAALLLYKEDVEAAATTAELQAANQEIKQYLIDNKDVYKENVQMIVEDLSEYALVKAKELEAKIDQALTVLKITCPEQKSTIEEVETQLNQLKAESQQLAEAYEAGDTAAMKSEMQQMAQLSKDIAANLNEIYSACF